MTKLSLLVLLADISHSAAIAAGLIGVLLICIGIVLTVWKCGGFTYETHKEHKVTTYLCYIFSIVFFIIAGILPSKKTVYIISGIEAVNEFSKTEVAKELGDSGMSLVKDITQIAHVYTLDALKKAKKSTKRRDDYDD